MVFLASPVMAVGAAVAASVLIVAPAFSIPAGFSGDLIVIFYLLAVPSISYMIGAAASANVLAITGAAREIKLMLSYELPFLLVLATVVFKTGMSLKISDILAYQATHGALIGSLSGVLLFVVALMCIQAKLGLVPFDISEAETEITHGLFIEYSGPAYFLVKLAKYIMLFTLASFAVVLFMGGFHWTGAGIAASAGKLLLVVLLFTLVRNTNPRLRPDQSMRFFFLWMNVFVILAFILALLGL